MLDITIQLQSPGWKKLLRPYCKTVEQTLALALEHTPYAKVEAPWSMAVVLADDAFIQALNHTYRSKNKPTNVLSFPGGHGTPRARAKANDTELGDIILAIETIEREAHQQQKTFRHHAQHLLVHGLLHLIGHDHEEPQQASRMEALEIKILKMQGIANPYL